MTMHETARVDLLAKRPKTKHYKTSAYYKVMFSSVTEVAVIRCGN